MRGDDSVYLDEALGDLHHDLFAFDDIHAADEDEREVVCESDIAVNGNAS